MATYAGLDSGLGSRMDKWREDRPDKRAQLQVWATM